MSPMRLWLMERERGRGYSGLLSSFRCPSVTSPALSQFTLLILLLAWGRATLCFNCSKTENTKITVLAIFSTLYTV